MEKFKSRRFILTLVAILVVVVYGDTKAVNAELIIQWVGIIGGLGIGFIGLEDAVRAWVNYPELKKIIEDLFSSQEEHSQFPDR